MAGVLDVCFTLLKKEPLETLAAASSSITFISIILGELGNHYYFSALKKTLCLLHELTHRYCPIIVGRKRSRANFLKFYIVGSSIGILVSIASVIQSNIQLKARKFLLS